MKLQTTIENIKANPEAFAKVLCEALGIVSGAFEGLDKQVFLYRGNWLSYRNLATNLFLDVIFDVEKAVIEKVGDGRIYAEQLVKVVKGWECCEPLFLETVAEIATADAPTRLCAMLLALGIDEIEVKENVS